MKSRWPLVLISALFGLTTASPTNAAIIYQSVTNLTADVGGAGALCSSCGGQDQVFDPFGISAAAAVDEIQFDAYNYSLYFPTDVSVEIYGYNGAGIVGSLVFSETFSPSNFVSTFNFTMGGQPATLVTVAPSGLNLKAGEYYISFYNPSNYASIQFPGSGPFGQLYQAGGEGLVDLTTPFALSNSARAVPEASSWAMLLLGFAGLGYAGYRRRGALARA